jgi:hypothetical protein
MGQRPLPLALCGLSLSRHGTAWSAPAAATRRCTPAHCARRAWPAQQRSWQAAAAALVPLTWPRLWSALRLHSRLREMQLPSSLFWRSWRCVQGFKCTTLAAGCGAALQWQQAAFLWMQAAATAEQINSPPCCASLQAKLGLAQRRGAASKRGAADGGPSSGRAAKRPRVSPGCAGSRAWQAGPGWLVSVQAPLLHPSGGLNQRGGCLAQAQSCPGVAPCC